MDKQSQKKCIELTSSFYSETASSFSETRDHPWCGWQRVLSSIQLPVHTRVLDVACGNMRFEKFLHNEGISVEEILCLDNCSDLKPFDLPNKTRFLNIDLSCDEAFDSLSKKFFDLVVSFGFFHHIPAHPQRKDFLSKLIDATKPGGYIAVSFWQFMKDPRIANKAQTITPLVAQMHSISLDHDDYFLSWKNRDEVFRYCHNFSDEEIQSFSEQFSDKVTLVSDFSEDGKYHNLNRYLTFQRKASACLN